VAFEPGREIVDWRQGGELRGHKVNVSEMKSRRIDGSNEYIWEEQEKTIRLPVEPDALFAGGQPRSFVYDSLKRLTSAALQSQTVLVSARRLAATGSPVAEVNSEGKIVAEIRNKEGIFGTKKNQDGTPVKEVVFEGEEYTHCGRWHTPLSIRLRPTIPPRPAAKERTKPAS
jgi:hypothetical protein